MKEYNVLVFEREKKQVSTIFGPAYFVLQMQPGFGTSTWSSSFLPFQYVTHVM